MPILERDVAAVVNGGAHEAEAEITGGGECGLEEAAVGCNIQQFAEQHKGSIQVEYQQ